MKAASSTARKATLYHRIATQAGKAESAKASEQHSVLTAEALQPSQAGAEL